MYFSCQIIYHYYSRSFILTLFATGFKTYLAQALKERKNAHLEWHLGITVVF